MKFNIYLEGWELGSIAIIYDLFNEKIKEWNKFFV
jgi:hypothetical protein